MALEDNIEFPINGIKIQTSNTKAYINDKEYGNGTLCVAER